MEGVGYWVILIIIYLISALAKKRQQTQRREMLDDDGEGAPAPSPGPMGGSDFMRNLLKEAGFDFEEEDEGEVEIASPEEVYQQPQPVVIPTPDQEEEERAVTIRQQIEEFDREIDEEMEAFEDAENVEFGVPEYSTYHRRLRRVLPDLDDKKDWRQAIIMKEILDKPRSLRRTIR